LESQVECIVIISGHFKTVYVISLIFVSVCDDVVVLVE
jgi:hypothetical protein